MIIMEARVIHPADVRTANTCHVPAAGQHDDNDECCGCNNSLADEYNLLHSVRSHNGILNPFFRFIHRFSGEYRDLLIKITLVRY